jgi:hypothetical protein
MTIYFGASFFHRSRESDLAERTTAVLTRFGGTFAGQEIRFQGMFAGSDKFSRLRQPSRKALEQLASDIREGVFSSLLVFARGETTTQGTLSMDLVPANGRTGLASIDFVAACYSGDVQFLTESSRALWETFAPSYGFEVWGDSDSDVRAELTGVPIRPWNDPLPQHEEARLLRLQSIRRSLGSISRGAAWGSYLGEELVMRLQSSGRDLSAAPVERVEHVAGGVYLRLREQPLLVGTDEFSHAAAALEVFLEPTMEHS